MDAKAKHRLFYMDVARAVAIVLVTAYHLWRHFGSPKISVFSIPFYKVAAMGYVGVDLFFVVSGFAMMMTWGSPKSSWAQQSMTFYRARLGRILPPYLAAVAFWCGAVSLGANPKPIGLLDIVSHLTFTHSLLPSTFFSISGVLWSLAIEVQFYVVFPLLMRIDRAYLFVLLSVFACLTHLIDESAPIAGPASFVMRWNVVTYMPLFLLGMVIFDSRKASEPCLRRFVAWSLGALAVMLYARDYSLFLGSREIIGATLGIAFLRYMPDTRSDAVVVRSVTTVAAASYSIYLYNYIFITSIEPLARGYIGFALYFSWVFIFGLFMWWLIERPAEAYRHHQKTVRGQNLSEPQAPNSRLSL